MSLVSLKYAHALSGAVSDEALDPTFVQTQLQEFADVLSGSAELREAMESPAIHTDEKLNVLDAVLAEIVLKKKERLIRNFLAVLIDHDRLMFLPEVLRDYRSIMEEQQGIAEIEVTSAKPLAAKGRTLLEKQIATMIGNTVKASYSEDSKLLGGVVVRWGSTIYDGSVQGRLDRLKQELMQG